MTSSENSHVFIWKNFKEWKPVLEDMFKDILTPELKAEVKQNAVDIEGYYRDCKDLIGPRIETMITTEIIIEFRRRYSHIRAYHGCRPIDVQSYYKKGLLPLCKEEQVKRFIEIFLSGDFPELTEEMLQQSVKIAEKKDDGLYICIDDRQIIEFASQYLIYGSEYLQNLVTNLPIENAKEKYLPVLGKIGKPTVFEINLPNTTEYVDDDTIIDVIKRMITEWVYCLAHSRTENHIFSEDILFRKPILGEHICSPYRHFL